MRTFLATAALLLLPTMAAAEDDYGWREAHTVDPLGKTDRVYGNPQADLSLIVWLDPECPYCKVFGTKPEQVVDAANGKLNLAVRLFPLSFHGRNAMIASASALCVADQAGAAGYYKFLDAYLAMTGSNGKGLAPRSGQSDPVVALAGVAGADDRATLAACTHAPATGQRLATEMAGAERAGVSGTPAIAIRNNRTGETIMADGALSEEDIKAAVNYLANHVPG